MSLGGALLNCLLKDKLFNILEEVLSGSVLCPSIYSVQMLCLYK